MAYSGPVHEEMGKGAPAAPIAPDDGRLSMVIQALAGSSDLDEALAIVVRQGLAGLAGDAAVVVLRNDVDPDSLDVVAYHGMDPATVDQFDPMPIDAPLPITDCVRLDEEIWIGSLAERDARYPALAGHFVEREASVSMPIAVDGEVVGALGFVLTEARTFTPDERTLLRSLAAACALTLDRLRLRHMLAEVNRAEKELARARAELLRSELTRLQEHEIVHALQAAALPQSTPTIDGLEVAASYIPAQERLDVGGDWYDIVELDDGSLLLSVGDVSGHGIQAAGIMSQLRTAIRAYAVHTPHVEHILSHLNDFLCRQDNDCFATAVVARYDPTTHELRWSVAGHPPPIRFGRSVAALSDRSDCRGTVLGAWRGHAYRACSARLAPGEGVFLFTDGLVERRGECIDDGIHRLEALLRVVEERPLDGVVDHVMHGMLVELRDDVCALAIRRSRG
jgi:serine phosphatase RsbU (regulator of sigma subunit)